MSRQIVPAEKARTACDRKRNDHAIAFGDRRHIVTDRLDHSGCFKAQSRGKWHGIKTGSLIRVDEVHADCSVLYAHVAGARRREIDVPVRYVAARRQGGDLHVEVDAAGRCNLDLLGADRMVVRGGSAATIGVAGSRGSAPVGTGAPATEASPLLKGS